jgi:electron-transferring-flavoprotein dehydrogenase
VVEVRHLIGMMLGGLDMWTNTLFGFSFFGTQKPWQDRCASPLEPASQHQKIVYPKPDGVI